MVHIKLKLQESVFDRAKKSEVECLTSIFARTKNFQSTYPLESKFSITSPKTSIMVFSASLRPYHSPSRVSLKVKPSSSTTSVIPRCGSSCFCISALKSAFMAISSICGVGALWRGVGLTSRMVMVLDIFGLLLSDTQQNL